MSFRYRGVSSPLSWLQHRIRGNFSDAISHILQHSSMIQSNYRADVRKLSNESIPYVSLESVLCYRTTSPSRISQQAFQLGTPSLRSKSVLLRRYRFNYFRLLTYGALTKAATFFLPFQYILEQIVCLTYIALLRLVAKTIAGLEGVMAQNMPRRTIEFAVV